MKTYKKNFFPYLSILLLLMFIGISIAYGELSKTIKVAVLNIEFDHERMNELNQTFAEDHYHPYRKCIAHAFNQDRRVDLTGFLKGNWEHSALNISRKALLWTIDGEEQESSFLEHGNPSDFSIEEYRIQVSFRDIPDEFLDRLILVIVPENAERDHTDWFDNESDDMDWLQELPAPYSSLELRGVEPFIYMADPEPDTCLCQRWREQDYIDSFFHPGAEFEMRSEETAGGHGHQANYDETGEIIEEGLAAGSADRVSPPSVGHDTHDVNPFIRAAQLDGNPIEQTLWGIGTDLTAPILHKGDNLNNYFIVRPIKANDRPKLPPGYCSPEPCRWW